MNFLDYGVQQLISCFAGSYLEWDFMCLQLGHRLCLLVLLGERDPLPQDFFWFPMHVCQVINTGCLELFSLGMSFSMNSNVTEWFVKNGTEDSDVKQASNNILSGAYGC